MQSTTESKPMREVPISPEQWEWLGPLHAKMEIHKDRIREVVDEMATLKKEMRMLMANTGWNKQMFFKALQKEFPNLKMETYSISLNPPRIVEEKREEKAEAVLEAAKALGIDIGDLLM